MAAMRSLIASFVSGVLLFGQEAQEVVGQGDMAAMSCLSA
jgi:hypothetical protein